MLVFAHFMLTFFQHTGLIQAAQATQEPKVKNTRVPGLRLAIAAHEIPHPAKVQNRQ